MFKMSSLQMDKNSCKNNKPRILIMGASKVGKTAIVEQFLYDRFPLDHVPTIEQLHSNVYDISGLTLTLELLDTSGVHEFPAMRRLNIKKADAFILVYSIDDKESFSCVSSIREQILEERQGDDRVPIVVVGNKCDLEDQRAVRKEIVESVVTMDWENGFVECSAKENINILEIFNKVLQQAHICYVLSKPVDRRRKSLPARLSYPKINNALLLKRNSCAMQ